MLALGLDIGSSSIKAAIIDLSTHQTLSLVKYPEQEMVIDVPKSGWAEQNPETWWSYTLKAIELAILNAHCEPISIRSIGISYQMHGLVMLDGHGSVVRPAIIWCDSRATAQGQALTRQLDQQYCLSHMLNEPGNFTASKLAWVKENEPHNFEKVRHIMLPGDYIAYKLTGQLQTTRGGLSEGIFWNFEQDGIDQNLILALGIDKCIFPEIVPTIGSQGHITPEVARLTGIPTQAIVGYRAGDQPNNALSLGVLHPGQIAATGGTSGVVYAVSDQLKYDEQGSVNSFAHINHCVQDPRIGVLLCINGAGAQHAWIRRTIDGSIRSYEDISKMADQVPVGAEKLAILPFGNGAERMLQNRSIGASIHGIQFHKHNQDHLYRASLEGIAFAFVYGIEAMRTVGIRPDTIRTGNDNLFQSKILTQTISNLTEARIDIMDTSGAVGAALASGCGIAYYASLEEAIQKVRMVESFAPQECTNQYKEAYQFWKIHLDRILHLHRS